MRRTPPEPSIAAGAYPEAVAVSVPQVRDHASLSHATAALSIVLAALAAAFGLATVDPNYFTARGFPLDDAWIHAVYGRELARTGTWAYNPGIAATGSTSPLWSVVLAVAHLVADQRVLTIFLIKWVGFALHVLTALVVYAAFPSQKTSESTSHFRLLGALLVALHPDLVSASVSGMEVPLATLVAAALVWAAARGGAVMFALLAAAAFLARPELVVIAVVLPLVAVTSDRRGVRLIIAAGLGIASAAAGLALRNVLVSGRPLPATFYAKVGQGADPGTALVLGFGSLIPELAIAPLAIAFGLLALVALRLRPSSRPCPTAAPAFIAGLVYCATSFLLITPNDPGAFYHQRYILPALPLLLAAATVLVGAALPESLLDPRRSSAGAFNFRRVAGSLATAALAFALVIDMPARYHHLANDARNIDDVQVAIGRFLATAAPTDVIWAVDAGAVRYFGNAFVVDLMGLNTPELLTASAQSFLDAHRPRYLEVVPLWAYLDSHSTRALPLIAFTPSTPYTVTAFAAMQTHHLVRCDPGITGDITVRTRTDRFACAP